jgi:hypothetical protein
MAALAIWSLYSHPTTYSAGSKTCGEKVGGEESSKLSDNRANCPDIEYDNTADQTEPSNNNCTLTDQKQGDPHTQDNTATITPEQAERIARNRRAALERADERRREQQENSGAVTAALVQRQATWRKK